MTDVYEEFKKMINQYAKDFSENFITYVIPDIPEKKLDNAINSYANNVNKAQVIALCDLTFMGSGKVGFLITPAGFYYKNSYKSISFNFQEISSILLVEGKKKFLEIYLNTDRKVIIDNSLIKLEVLHDFFTEVLKFKAQGLLNETDKFVIVEDMDDEVKKII